jgi:hypothetical protein
MRARQDLFPATPTIEAFLTDLAGQDSVAVATQNQAMNASGWAVASWLTTNNPMNTERLTSRDARRC